MMQYAYKYAHFYKKLSKWSSWNAKRVNAVLKSSSRNTKIPKIVKKVVSYRWHFHFYKMPENFPEENFLSDPCML